MNQQNTVADIKLKRPRTSKRRLVAMVLLISIVGTAIGGWGRGSAAAAPGRCDMTFNTNPYNLTAAQVSTLPDRKVVAPVGFSLAQWVDVFTDESLGLNKATVLAQLKVNPNYNRQILGGVLTSKLGTDWWMPSTNTAECSALRNQLQTARDVAFRYPIAAYAAGAGYVRTSNYLGGVGVHYQNTNMANLSFDPSRPAQILYDGAQSNANIVGLSYFVRSPGNTPPEGFVGKNDRWLRHDRWCLDSSNILLAADVLSPQECTALGGQTVVNPGWWTLHVWLVPGCESDWGLFSNSNLRLPYMRAGMRRSVGCGRNIALTAPPALDTRGTYKIK